MLDARFSMTVGETVVAGSSRTGSGEGPVVMLTALAQEALK
jgi:hypothetical protein